jgi:hypothetical protein
VQRERRRPSAEKPIAEKPHSEPPPPLSGSDDTNGVFGPFRIGFLVGTGLPDVLNFGGTIKLTPYFGAGINVGLIPSIHLSLYGDATVSYQEYDAYGHIHPFGGAFFFGAAIGYATMRGKFDHTYNAADYNIIVKGIPSALTVDSEATVRTLVLTPQLGLLHTFGSGFTVGIDAGLQVPVAPSQVKYATKVTPPVYDSLCSINDQCRSDRQASDEKVRSTLDTIGRTMLPTFNLRIGWLL